MWAFRRAIVINDKLVPTVRLMASLIDPFRLSRNIQGVDLSVDMEVNVVIFSNIARLSWLVGPPGTHSSLVWRAHAKNFPLLKEIKESVKQGETIMEGEITHARATKDSKTFLFVEVRGKILLVANTHRRLSLALTGHPGVEAGSFEDEVSILSWFLTELVKDITTFKEDAGDSLSSCSSSDTKEEDDATGRHAAITNGLAVLRASSAVRLATWQQERGAFKITKKEDKSMKEFRVVPSKKRKANVTIDEDMTRAVEEAVASGLLWAEGKTLPSPPT